MKITQMISDISFYDLTEQSEEDLIYYTHNGKEFCIEYELEERYHISLFSPEWSSIYGEVVIRPNRKDESFIYFKSNMYLEFKSENAILTYILNESGPDVFDYFAELFAILEMPDKIIRN